MCNLGSFIIIISKKTLVYHKRTMDLRDRNRNRSVIYTEHLLVVLLAFSSTQALNITTLIRCITSLLFLEAFYACSESFQNIPITYSKK